MDNQFCQICDRDALYMCGNCKYVAYCSNEHRLEHWRIHKDDCKILQTYSETKNQSEVQRNRLIYRKQYFDTFFNKIYDRALKIAQQLLVFEKNHIQSTRLIENQFEYGITVCLLCRTLIILQKISEAKIEITEYLKQKEHFLQDMRDVCRFPQPAFRAEDRTKGQGGNQEPKKQYNAAVTEKQKQFLRKKLELISAVANIFHSLSLPPIKFYMIYLNHVEFAFGPDSLEASNCYFLMGIYYMEQNQYNRSIACFVRAADIRGQKGGDCFYNLSIIYQIRGKLNLAVKMHEQAIKYYEEQQGQSSIEVAKVNEDIAQIMIKKKDWNGAIKAYQRALKIYAVKNELAEFQIIKQKIKALHEYMKKVLQAKDKSDLPKQIQDQLIDKKAKIIDQNELKAEDMSFLEESKRNKDRLIVENLFKLSESFLSKLNPLEIMRLSELQLELQNCNSEFAIAYTVGNSEFLKKLSEKRLKQMKEENQKLFELLNIERKTDFLLFDPRLT